MRRARDLTLRMLMRLSALCVCLVLIALIGFVLVRGLPGLSWQFLTGQTSYLRNTIGILPNILNTLYIIFVTMLIALPLGVCTAVYLTEYAKNRRLVRLISFATDTLTGIPSILFGLVGMLFFIRFMGLKAGVLSGGLTLSIMVLPTIISNTRESLKRVPMAWRDGCLALGSGRWHMVRTVVLPGAMDGIVTGCILAIGRVVGESAALLFTAGFGLALTDFVHSLQSSSATLTVALYVYACERGDAETAFAIASVLMVLTLLLNLLAAFTARRLRHQTKEGAPHAGSH